MNMCYIYVEPILSIKKIYSNLDIYNEYVSIHLLYMRVKSSKKKRGL